MDKIKILNSTYQNKSLRYVWFIVLLLAVKLNVIYSQSGCDIPLSCNGNVQVSLNINCEETLTAKSLVKNMAFPEESYRVVVKNNRGVVIPNNKVTKDHIGQRLEVAIFLDECGTSCWGYAWIEDKLPPTISGCDTVTVNCGANLTPVTGIPRPTAVDACGPTTFKVLPDIVEKFPCPNEFEKFIKRTWIFTDAYGNSATCMQIIRVRRTSLNQVQAPKSYDDIELPVLECGIFNNFLPSGAPDPAFTGRPINSNCDNIQVNFKDITFPLCGNGKKILREWLVIDWCTGRDTTLIQVIKIVDKRGPANPTHPTLIDLKTDQKKCSATYKLPHPGATDCSSYGYIVGFRVKNKFGDYGDTIYHSPKIISNPDNTYTLIDIGLDTTIVIYKMTDACGNTSYSTLRIVVQDKEAPSANCEGFIVVSLKENGWAELSAESVNSGSTDNCKIVKLEVRRLSTRCPGFGIDTTFKSSVNFCCEDINPSPSQYIKVVLRVTDASGNSNECISNVKVQDKIPPVFTYCPPNITLECYEDYRDFNLTGGTATATDNCGVRVLAPTDTPGLNKCGIGTVTRRWTARDSQGLAVQCTQIITLINSTPFSEEHVIFPKDTTVNTCYNPDQLSPDFLQSKPYLHPQACADLAISYTDDYYQVDNACHKIIRTWRVIDWCTYSVNNSHFIYKTQVILVKDLQGPTVTFGCTNRTISAQDDCSAIVHHRIEATDNCTPANLLRYSWEIDLFNNQTIDDKGFGPSISDTFPAGSHKMIFRVVDGCGNETICRYDFVINNNKKPTPVCLGEVAWVLDKNGRAEIWAKDFDLKSESFCGVNKTLRFSFTQNVRDSGRVFTCANIPNGVSARIPIRMYVFDSNNNFDFCDVTLVLQDSPLTNACPNNFAGGGMISGLVVDSRLQKAESVGVVLEDITDNSTKKVITNSEGKYEFTGTEFNKNYVLKPEKMDDVDLGVNTLDLVTLQRHILGIQRLNSPYHLIAADVDNDQKITLSDLIALRRIILGISNELPNNRPWRFVPRDFKFDENKPFDLREIKVYDNLEVDDMAADFMMIKVGDVDAAYNTNGLFGRSSSSIPVYYERDEDKINFFAGANIEMSGLEMSFTLNTFGSILPGVIDLNGNEAYFEGNKLKLSWVSKTNSKAIKENDLLFTLISSSNKDAGITNLQSEFYSGELETFDINLLPRSNAKGETRILSFPNPFVDKTMLSYYVEKDGEVNITIYDQQGKSIYNNKLNAVKGENKITIHRNDLPAVGMYLLNVNTSTNSQTIKLMLVD